MVDEALGTFALKAHINAFKGDFALLRLEKSGSELLWPREALAADVKVGDEVSLSIGSPKQTEAQKLQIVRKILEELVN